MPYILRSNGLEVGRVISPVTKANGQIMGTFVPGPAFGQVGPAIVAISAEIDDLAPVIDAAGELADTLPDDVSLEDGEQFARQLRQIPGFESIMNRAARYNDLGLALYDDTGTQRECSIIGLLPDDEGLVLCAMLAAGQST